MYIFYYSLLIEKKLNQSIYCSSMYDSSKPINQTLSWQDKDNKRCSKVGRIRGNQLGCRNRGQISFRRSISLRGYPVDSGFGADPGGQLKWDHSGSPSREGGRGREGRGKFGRISWITNEERNDIKLTDFRTHNHGTNSVRQRCW